MQRKAIYYVFDRDSKSNVDKDFIENMISLLVNSRDNPGYDRQGMLLLSYPSIESFTVSGFKENVLELQFDTGNAVKVYTSENNINHQKLSEKILIHTVEALFDSFNKIGIDSLNLDDFAENNKAVYDYEESEFAKNKMYRVLSLLSVAFIDLGLIEVIE